MIDAEDFIREVLRLWMMEHGIQGEVRIEKKPPTETRLPQTANENVVMPL